MDHLLGVRGIKVGIWRMQASQPGELWWEVVFQLEWVTYASVLRGKTHGAFEEFKIFNVAVDIKKTREDGDSWHCKGCGAK